MELPGTEEENTLPSGCPETIIDGTEKKRRRRRRIRRKKNRGTAAEEMLPSDCWEKIFDKLDEYKEWGPISLVCKSFLSITNTMRRKLDFHVTDYYVDDSSPYYVTAPEISRLLTRFPCLEEIQLFRDDHADSNNRGAIDSVMFEIFKNYNPTTSHLRSLHVSCRCDCVYQSRRLNRFASFAPPAAAAMSAGLNNNIKVLNCSVCKIDDRILQDIGYSFPFLEELYLSDPCHLRSLDDPTGLHTGEAAYSDKGIQFLTSNLKYLKKFSLVGMPFDTSLVALSSCTSLTHLSVDGFFMNITAHGIGYLLAHCQNMVSLSLSRAVGGGFSSLVLGLAARPLPCSLFTPFENSITYHAKNLQCLELPSVFQPNDCALSSIVSANLPLRKLSFVASGCTLSGLSLLLGTYLPTLSSLHIRDAKILDDDSLANLLLNSSPPPNNLTEIGFDECFNLTNTTFLHLVRNCPSLTSIEMTSTSLGKDNNHNNLHKELFQNENIQRIKLHHNYHMDNRTLESIGKICPNLKHLSVVLSRRVTIKGITKILNRCNKIRILHLLGRHAVRGLRPSIRIPKLPNMEELYLRFSTLRDVDLASIADSCCGLRILDLDGNLVITDTSVMIVVQKCERLKQIILRDCCLSQNIKSKILAINPLLRISITPLI